MAPFEKNKLIGATVGIYIIYVCQALYKIFKAFCSSVVGKSLKFIF